MFDCIFLEREHWVNCIVVYLHKRDGAGCGLDDLLELWWASLSVDYIPFDLVKHILHLYLHLRYTYQDFLVAMVFLVYVTFFSFLFSLERLPVSNVLQ
jgi:hypothetical protein